MTSAFKSLSESLRSVFSLKTFESNFRQSPETMPNRRNAKMRIDRFADELPYAHFDEEDNLCAIEAPDGSYEGLSFVIELHPQTGANPTMAKSFEQVFGHGLPEGTGVQVSLFGSPYIKPLTDLIAVQSVKPSCEDDAERAEQKALLSGMSEQRADFLLKASVNAPHGDKNMRARNLRCWISVVVPTKTPFEPAVRNKVINIRDSIFAACAQWSFAPWVWNKSALINTLSQILNPHELLNQSWKPSEPDHRREPKMQCVFRDTKIEVTNFGIRFKSRHNPCEVTAFSMSPRTYPQELTLAQMIHMAGDAKGIKTLGFPFLITTYLSKFSFEKAKARTQLKSARAEQMAATEIARFIPSMQEEARDWRVAHSSFERGEGLIQLAHQVLAFTEEDNVSDAFTSVKGVFGEMGIELCADDFMHMQGLMVALPMTGGPLLAFDVKLAQRATTKTVANAANSVPLLGDWKGTGARGGEELPRPVLSLLSRRGQLLHIDPFANPHGNYNGVVIGGSGSGKSVFLNELALGSLRTGGRVWIIDIGRSYQKLCSVLNGQWIELSIEPREDGAFDCLNPFSLIQDLDADMDLLLPVLAQMASPSKKLDDLMLAHLQFHVRFICMNAKAQGRSASVTDLAQSLLHNGRLGGAHPRFDEEWIRVFDAMSSEEQSRFNDPRLIDLGVQFLPFAKGGAFSQFFEGEANINFNNPFIVLELEQLNSRKALQSVVLMILMYMINLEMRNGDRAQHKLVIIDEAWDLMGEGNSAGFIEAGYRRARKLNGAFFTGTQKPGDYWKSSTAKAALDNADCMFLLSLKDQVLSEVKKDDQLGLDKYEFEMLSSLKPKAGVYSEIMVRIGDSPFSVNRLVLDPYSQLLMSTHPNDLAAINRFKSGGLSTHEAIEAVLAERTAASARL